MGLAFIISAHCLGILWISVRTHSFLYFQDSFPLRFKGMNAINEPTVFGYIFSIIKPFLKEKTRSSVSTVPQIQKLVVWYGSKYTRISLWKQLWINHSAKCHKNIFRYSNKGIPFSKKRYLFIFYQQSGTSFYMFMIQIS